jgi:hypothetical protein
LREPLPLAAAMFFAVPWAVANDPAVPMKTSDWPQRLPGVTDVICIRFLSKVRVACTPLVGIGAFSSTLTLNVVPIAMPVELAGETQSVLGWVGPGLGLALGPGLGLGLGLALGLGLGLGLALGLGLGDGLGQGLTTAALLRVILVSGAP